MYQLTTTGMCPGGMTTLIAVTTPTETATYTKVRMHAEARLRSSPTDGNWPTQPSPTRTRSWGVA